jgi:hypothetical protein
MTTPPVSSASSYPSLGIPCFVEPSADDTQFDRAAKLALPILGTYFVGSWLPYSGLIFTAGTIYLSVLHAKAPAVINKEPMLESAQKVATAAIMSVQKMVACAKNPLQVCLGGVPTDR